MCTSGHTCAILQRRQHLCAHFYTISDLLIFIRYKIFSALQLQQVSGNEAVYDLQHRVLASQYELSLVSVPQAFRSARNSPIG